MAVDLLANFIVFMGFQRCSRSGVGAAAKNQKIAACGSSYGDRVFREMSGAPDKAADKAKASVECCSLLFIVKPGTVQLFSRSCSFLFSNECRSPFIFKKTQPDQSLVVFGTIVALLLRSPDSNNKKAEPCH
ncbi:hypothetical protein [Pseudomonas fluorescens]|uniref:hypothetical protein n=1 Tax=Pseudomonas fluorescens TaxID=294 RepID=UPI0012426BDF|nr:hypothetical protein [Pseudomonas fluorescens]